MSDISYPFNPWGDLEDAHVSGEVQTLTPAQGKNYVTIYPRAAPFHSLSMKIKVKGQNSYLIKGQDWIPSNFYNGFTRNFKVGIFGSITFLNVDAPKDVELEYDTVGGEFVLDDQAYATLVANLLTNDRYIDWSQIVDAPTEYPPAPHAHPAGDTYNYSDFIEVMTGIWQATSGGTDDLVKALQDHIDAEGTAAHPYTKDDVGLGNVDNFATATPDDLKGSGQLFMTLDMVKTLMRQVANGTITL